MASTPVPMNAGVAQATNPYMSYDQIMRNRGAAMNAGRPQPMAQQAQQFSAGVDASAAARQAEYQQMGVQSNPSADMAAFKNMQQTAERSAATTTQPVARPAGYDSYDAMMRNRGAALNAGRQAPPTATANQAAPKSAMESTQRKMTSPQTNRSQFAGTSRGTRGMNTRSQGASSMRSRGNRGASNPADQQAAYQRAMSRVSA